MTIEEIMRARVIDDILTCPGCGCEAEIVKRLIDKNTGERVGYICSCTAYVIDGVVLGFTAN